MWKVEQERCQDSEYHDLHGKFPDFLQNLQIKQNVMTGSIVGLSEEMEYHI